MNSSAVQLFSIFHAEQLLIALIFHFSLRYSTPAQQQFLFDPVIVIEGLDSVGKTEMGQKVRFAPSNISWGGKLRAYYVRSDSHATIYYSRFSFPFFSSHLLFLYNSRKEYYCYICPNVPDFVCILLSPSVQLFFLILRFTPCYQRQSKTSNLVFTFFYRPLWWT